MTLQDTINQQLTERFINDNPVTISVDRYAMVATPSGGSKKGTKTTLPAQTMTKINPTLRGQMVELTLEDGHVIVPSFALVAKLSADIQRDDEFDLDGKRFTVVLVDESRDDWAKRAYVTRWDG